MSEIEITNKPRILIIDDQEFVRKILFDLLNERYECVTAGDPNEVADALSTTEFDVVLSDINLGSANGIDLLPLIHQHSPDAAVVMISGNRTIENAIDAMRGGAFDYITKPFDLDHVDLVISRAVEHSSLLKQKRNYEAELEHLVEQRTHELNYVSYHDTLTDLPNRVLFEDRLTQSIRTARDQDRIAVMLVTLDGFKKYQDTLGRSTAVTLIRHIGERLSSVIVRPANLSRLDGAEFAVLVPHYDCSTEIAAIAQHLLECVKAPFKAEAEDIYLTASIGVSLYPHDGTSPEVMLKNAGAALLRAREEGGDNYQFYEPGMNKRALRRLALESGLRRALERGEFELHYQPKVSTNGNRLVGMEALLRWRHPEEGLVSPSDFIPLAEESGLVLQIGEWVIREACRFARSLHDRGHKLSIAVNLSARQLRHPELADIIISILDETGLSARYLNLEITESTILHDAEAAAATLKRLKEIGMKISLDDFGTGYSSLGHLKKLPIDVLKIDKSFIRDVTTNPDDASLVMALVGLAHNLRLKVVAEGIETEEQLRFLNLLRCDEYQGFLFSKPLNADEFAQLAARSRPKASGLSAEFAF